MAAKNGASNGANGCKPTRWEGQQSDLENKVALVTGSTSGIGLGIAQSLASRGCNILLTGLGDEETIQRIRDEFTNDYNVKSDYVFADLASSSDIDRMCGEILKIYPQGIDILINNAGFQHVCPIEDFPPEKWDAMLAVMLSAPFYLIKNLLPTMKQKGWGRVVNISSAHGVVASPNKSAYVAAKHGLVGLTKVIALEAAGTGVTCNALCPGYVATPILQKQVQTVADKKGLPYDEAKEEFIGMFHPSKECIEIGQLADMVRFICSDSASQMTGSSIVMDGGWTAK